jgi:hypothetical protein
VTGSTLKSNRPEDLVELKIGLFIPCYIDVIYPEVGRVSENNAVSSVIKPGSRKE